MSAPIKLFKDTWDGDRVRIIFTHQEEKDAFEQALDLLRERILKNTKREEPVTDFHFETTLQTVVVCEKLEVFRRIAGVEVLNFLGGAVRETGMYIVPSPEQ